MSGKFRVACVQNCAEREMAPSIEAVSKLIRAAAKDGADLIQLPELVHLFEPDNDLVLKKTLPEAKDPGVAVFRVLAKETGAWIVVGSVLLKKTGSDKIVNRCLVIDPAGSIVSRYDKIHLFDVDLANGETYRESASVNGGDRAVLAPTPWGLLGLTICYDLRFAYLHRALAHAGASFLSIPAA